MQQALRELRTFKLSPEEYERYLVYKMGQYDVSEADPEDLAIKAAKQAKMEGKMEIAKSLLSSGMSMTDVCKHTGLKSSDISLLKNLSIIQIIHIFNFLNFLSHFTFYAFVSHLVLFFSAQ